MVEVKPAAKNFYSLAKALGRWDIFVFSTTAQEGFGNAAAEAMAHGLPCIFTDVGPCREVGAEAVEYVPQGDDRSLAERIAALASDASRRSELASAARARAQSCFGAERKLSDFLSLAFDS